MTVRWRGRHVFDQIGANLIEGLPQYILGTQYFVSANDGNDNNAGTSPDKPVATIQAAIDLANTLIDWSAVPMKRQVIWVEPGVYAENLTPAYYCDIVGLGIRGTDQMAEVNPASGSAMTGTLLGSGFHNMRFEGKTASTPIFDIGIGNNSVFHKCCFALGANVAGVAAIDTENATHLTIEECNFESGQLQNLAYAIYHRGGADKFAHNCRYIRNIIFAATAGIWIQSTCTASQAVALENNIIVDGTGKGIDGSNGGGTGYLVAIKNRIIVAGAGDAIAGVSAGNMMHNETNVNGVFAYETA